MHKSTTVLIIGSSGMLGNTLTSYLSFKKELNVFGIQRLKSSTKKNIKLIYLKKFSSQKILETIKKIKPKYVINCAGIINHKIKNNIEEVFFMNSYLPKILSHASKIYKFCFVHISTDCVFNGKKGGYNEKNIPNANDIYGLSKLIGETNVNSITIRTSIFGHEKKTKFGLLEWFLNAKKKVKGYKNFFFTGLTTLELSKIIYEYILKSKKIKKGLFHVGGKKISKLNLLKEIKKQYKKKNINYATILSKN